MSYSCENIESAVELLRELVRIPSYTFHEGKIADFLENYLTKRSCGYILKRVGNNIVIYGDDYSLQKVTLLFCAHIDSVKESEEYSFDPFCATLSQGKILGLGSNDDKGSVTAALFAFFYYIKEVTQRRINVVVALCAEEERGGENGITLLLNSFAQLNLRADYAIICEPTGLEAAIAEKGLLVIDGTAKGVSGHAARNEGMNAIYIALEDIDRLRRFRFTRVSPLSGEVMLSVTQINGGSAHNVIPDKCTFTVDIRPTELYGNEEILSMLSRETKSALVARNLKNRSSATPKESPLYRWAVRRKIKMFVSPTASDWTKVNFPALKIGPGESQRSHKADEYITVEEIKRGIELYTDIIDFINKEDNIE